MRTRLPIRRAPSIALLAVSAGWIALGGGCPRKYDEVPARTPSAPVPVVRTPGPARFEGDFEARLRASAPDRRWVALVDLDAQVDLDALGRLLTRERRSKRGRRDAVIRALEETAARFQDPLRPVLDRLVSEGRLDYWRGFAIVNRILVEGRAEGLLAVAAEEGVAWIRPDWTSERRGRLDATLTPEGAMLPARFTSWAVVATGADELWKAGLDGEGVTVASIDTGLFGGHEQLAGRALPSPRSWYDPVEGSASPRDAHGHGTSVLSVAVGGNPDGRIVGIAPRASWASALGNWMNFYSRSRMTQAADWILRTARPDILVNAWSHDEEDECGTFDLPFVRAWQAAEIFVVFPSGNAGPGPATGESPAQLAGGFPDGGSLFSVGALTPDGAVHRQSSRGPSRCGSPEYPSVVAPGADVPFADAVDPGAYRAGQGTSLAAGIVAGAAALLLEAVPEASPGDLARAFRDSARDLPPEGPDADSGAGAIDLPAALARLRDRVVGKDGH